MAGPDPTRSRRPAAQAPEAERVQRSRGGNGWRLSALLVAVLLVGIVAAGRLGMEPSRPPAGALPSPVAAASPTVPAPPTRPTPPTTPAPSATPAGPPLAPAPLPLVTRYADGIPTQLGGERVLRLPAALALVSEEPFLVGGWYMGPECGLPGDGGTCPFSRLSDSPADVSRRGGYVELTSLVAPGTGARVLRVVHDEECRRLPCLGRLRVEEVLWTGDPLTDAAPAGVVPMVSALSYAFQEMQLSSYNDLAQCPVPWPPQTFIGTGGGPRMTLIFPTTQDRLDAQAAVRAGRSLLLAEQGGDCLDRSGRRGSTSWIARDNVMMLIDRDEDTVALAEAAITDAIQASASPARQALAPITTWQALRRLWRVEPTLDLLPAYEQEVCVIGLPSEAYVLRDRQLRLLIVLSSRADRREFQRRLDGDAPPLLGRGCEPQPGRPFVDLSGLAWVGFENVIVGLEGTPRLADAVRDALRGTGTP